VEVRAAWSVIILVGAAQIKAEWVGVAHRDENRIKIIRDRAQNKDGKVRNRELHAGSKDEKMSSIIASLRSSYF